MTKIKFLTTSPSGFEGYGREVYEINDKLLSNFRKYGNYEIEVVEESGPNAEWTNAEIRAWLDKNGIEYKTRDSKSDLLSRVKT